MHLFNISQEGRLSNSYRHSGNLEEELAVSNYTAPHIKRSRQAKLRELNLSRRLSYNCESSLGATKSPCRYSSS